MSYTICRSFTVMSGCHPWDEKELLMMVRMHGEDDTLIPGGWLFCLKVHGPTACRVSTITTVILTVNAS